MKGPENDLLARYFQAVSASGVYPNAGNLQFAVRQLFKGVELAGARFLDIGAGTGVLGLYAACRGAAKVVCLEPEAAGSTRGVQQKFNENAAALGLKTVDMLPITFQDFEPGADPFDVIVLYASINHLDEQACIRLRRDENARRIYHEIFAKLYRLAADGATLIIADCQRRNFFADLGMRNPFMPTIEWHKHQSPRFWAGLISQAGFHHPWIRWTAFSTLRDAGRLILGNRFAAYFLTSCFYLSMRK